MAQCKLQFRFVTLTLLAVRWEDLKSPMYLETDLNGISSQCSAAEDLFYFLLTCLFGNPLML